MLGPCTSIYEWQGDVREENEFPVLLKTAIEKRAALMARLAELHSYDVPAILSWQVMANGPYADWIRCQTKSTWYHATPQQSSAFSSFQPYYKIQQDVM